MTLTPEVWGALLLTLLNGLFSIWNLRTRAKVNQARIETQSDADEAKAWGESLKGLAGTFKTVVNQQGELLKRWDDDRAEAKADRVSAQGERSEWLAELKRNTEASTLRIAAAQQTAQQVGEARLDLGKLATDVASGRQEAVQEVKKHMSETMQPIEDEFKARLDALEKQLQEVSAKQDLILAELRRQRAEGSAPAGDTEAVPAPAPSTEPIKEPSL